MDVDHQECDAEASSVLDPPTTTKADSVDVEMRVPENSVSKGEGDTKERDLERASEKIEPRDEDLVVAQQINPVPLVVLMKMWMESLRDRGETHSHSCLAGY
jgi:nuclear receptor co-repressor 1